LLAPDAAGLDKENVRVFVLSIRYFRRMSIIVDFEYGSGWRLMR